VHVYEGRIMNWNYAGVGLPGRRAAGERIHARAAQAPAAFLLNIRDVILVSRSLFLTKLLT